MKHQSLGPIVGVPHLSKDTFVTADGKNLAYTKWQSEDKPWAVVIALHGFNGYRGPFKDMAEYFSQNGIQVYAYDQRGFGEDEFAGLWAKKELLADDLLTFEDLVQSQNPGIPVFILGESMGGAVALYGFSGKQSPNGLILVAPAVWGWSVMNPLYQLGLWIGAHIMPGMTATGKNLGRVPSDNIEMLRELSRDPLIIKETRFDAIYGLVGIMESALRSAPQIHIPTLLLYGRHDELVPSKALQRLKKKLPNNIWVERNYESGFHMLLSDCQRGNVWRDIIHFMGDIVKKKEMSFTEPGVACQLGKSKE